MSQLIDTTPFTSGSTEPWTVDILCALMLALQPRHVLELGTFLGHTTAQLAGVLGPTATLTTVEHDTDRHATAVARFANDPRVRCLQGDTIAFLRTYAGPPFDFVFVDDDHTAAHVAEELDLLLGRGGKGRVDPMICRGGLICVHDVYGLFNLAPVVVARGGFTLWLPLLHTGGGLGFIQRAPDLAVVHT